MAFASEPHQFLQVLRAALADRVRKSGRAVHRKGDAFYLYENTCRCFLPDKDRAVFLDG